MGNVDVVHNATKKTPYIIWAWTQSLLRRY